MILVLTVNVLSIFEIPLFGIRVYKVASGSMEPYLKVDDLVFIKKSDDYYIDDIVTYKKEGNYITHRVTYIDDEYVITRGDTNNIEDEPISRDDVVGKVIFRVRLFGLTNYIISKQFSWVVLFIIGFVVICLVPEKKEKKAS